MKTYYKLGKEEIYLSIDIYRKTSNTVINAWTDDRDRMYQCLTIEFEKLEDPELAYLNHGYDGIDMEEFFVKNGLGVKVEGREKRVEEFGEIIIYPLYRLNLEKIKKEAADINIVTEEIAAEFAQKFFGEEGYELFCVPEFEYGDNSFDNTYIYQLGNFALNILPYYGADAFFDDGCGKRIVAKNPRAEVITLRVSFTNIELYKGQLVFVDCDKEFNEKKISLAGGYFVC